MQSTDQVGIFIRKIVSEEKPFKLNSVYSYFQLNSIKLQSSTKEPVEAKLYHLQRLQKKEIAKIKTFKRISHIEEISCKKKSMFIVEGGSLILRGYYIRKKRVEDIEQREQDISSRFEEIKQKTKKQRILQKKQSKRRGQLEQSQNSEADEEQTEKQLEEQVQDEDEGEDEDEDDEDDDEEEEEEEEEDEEDEDENVVEDDYEYEDEQSQEKTQKKKYKYMKEEQQRVQSTKTDKKMQNQNKVNNRKNENQKRKQNKVKQTLSKEDAMERAIVASKIIQIIKEETNKIEQGWPDLTTKITRLKIEDFKTFNQNQGGQIKQENLDAVRKLFKEGVVLKQCFLKQQRIRKGASDQGQNKQFIFFPTWMGTSSIFKFLINDRHQFPSQLITGSPGIGKTASMILFCLLMENIFRYALVAIQEQMIEMIKQKIIVRPLKVFYWSIGQEDDQQLIKKHFILQGPEFKQYLEVQRKLNWQNMEISAFFSKIIYYYRETLGIQIMVIIDQINFLAGLCRTANQKKKQLDLKKQQIKQIEKRKLNQEQQQQLRELKRKNNRIASQLLEARKNHFNLNRFRTHLDSIGNFKIYNSSVNIEQPLLKKKNQMYPYTLGIDGHNKLEEFCINYEQMIQSVKGTIELSHFAVFQFKKRGFTKSQYDERQLFEIFINSNIRSFTPLQISEKLQCYNNFQKNRSVKNLLKNKSITKEKKV